MNEKAGAPPRGETVQVKDLELHYHDHGAQGKKGINAFNIWFICHFFAAARRASARGVPPAARATKRPRPPPPQGAIPAVKTEGGTPIGIFVDLDLHDLIDLAVALHISTAAGTQLSPGPAAPSARCVIYSLRVRPSSRSSPSHVRSSVTAAADTAAPEHCAEPPRVRAQPEAARREQPEREKTDAGQVHRAGAPQEEESECDARARIVRHRRLGTVHRRHERARSRLGLWHSLALREGHARLRRIGLAGPGVLRRAWHDDERRWLQQAVDAELALIPRLAEPSVAIKRRALTGAFFAVSPAVIHGIRSLFRCASLSAGSDLLLP